MIWNPYAPKDRDVQVAKRKDMLACGPFSLTHCIEMWLKFKTGLFWEFSERGLASISQVTQNGSTLPNILNGVNNTGLVLASDWPELLYAPDYPDVTWNEFYTPMPDEVKKKAYRFSVQAQKINPAQVAQALEFAPIWTIIDAGTTNHIVAQMSEGDGKYGLGTYFDSYEAYIKDFQPSQPIISQHQLTIIPKDMPNSVFMHKANTQEYGFFLPAIDENALKDKALNLGLPITDVQGKVDFSLAKEVTGL